MKDEIKEILDYFRKYATIRENTMISEVEDYIINLQDRITNSLHLLKHNDIMDYRVFEDHLFNILTGGE